MFDLGTWGAVHPHSFLVIPGRAFTVVGRKAAVIAVDDAAGVVVDGLVLLAAEILKLIMQRRGPSEEVVNVGAAKGPVRRREILAGGEPTEIAHGESAARGGNDGAIELNQSLERDPACRERGFDGGSVLRGQPGQRILDPLLSVLLPQHFDMRPGDSTFDTASHQLLGHGS